MPPGLVRGWLPVELGDALLVVEDDARLADVLVRGLREPGYEVSLERDGRVAVEAAIEGHVDAIVLDWMLPRLDGPTVCRVLRGRGVETPILMLTPPPPRG